MVTPSVHRLDHVVDGEAATAAAVSASISTPVLSTVRTRASTR